MSRRPPRGASSQRMPGIPAITPKRAARLKTKKHREAERLFLAEGAAILEEAPTAPLMVFDRVEQLRRVSALKTPSGPVGVFPFLDVAATELLASVRRVVLLHGVQDPGNVGTAIRSAHAFGAGVALSRGSADLYNPKTVRAASRSRQSLRDGGRYTVAGALVERVCGGVDPALRGVFACATIIAHYDGERAHRTVEIRGTLGRLLQRFYRRSRGHPRTISRTLCGAYGDKEGHRHPISR